MFKKTKQKKKTIEKNKNRKEKYIYLTVFPQRRLIHFVQSRVN